MNWKRIVLIALPLLAFSAYTGLIIFTDPDGYLGFVWLALRERWAMQMLLDVGLALTLFLLWMWRDAKERRIFVWPYVIACLALGSIGALAYLLHRELRRAQEPAPGKVAGSGASSPRSSQA